MVRLLIMAAWVPRVVVFVARLEGRLSRSSMPQFLAGATPLSPRGPRLRAEEVVRVIWNVLRWERGPFNNGCFVRSFTRYRFLREAGYPVVFHLGVERADEAGAGAAGDSSGVRPEAGAAGDSGGVRPEAGAPGTAGRSAPRAPGALAGLRGHAWLTLDGLPFLEFDPERFAGYRELFRHPPEPRPAAVPSAPAAPDSRGADE